MKEIKIVESDAKIHTEIHFVDSPNITTGSVVPILQIEEPEWGERISFGTFLGEEQWVMRPLNRAAASLMDSSHMVALMMYDRVKELEGAISQMESSLEDAGIL